MFPLRDDRPTYSPPVVTTLIIVACVMVFFYENSLDAFTANYFVAKWALFPVRPTVISLVSAQFLHSGWMHIIGNMLFLWAFGRSMEDALGHTKFLGFYLLCGAAAAVAQIYFTSDARIPMVGASGAIAGLMGGYLLKFPKARIHTLVFLFVFVTTADIPAAFILIYWFVVQLLSGYGSITTTQVNAGGVAYFAHIGGFLMGMLLVQLMGTRSRQYRPREFEW